MRRSDTVQGSWAPGAASGRGGGVCAAWCGGAEKWNALDGFSEGWNAPGAPHNLAAIDALDGFLMMGVELGGI